MLLKGQHGAQVELSSGGRKTGGGRGRVLGRGRGRGHLGNWTPARPPPAPGHGGQGRELVGGDLGVTSPHGTALGVHADRLYRAVECTYQLKSNKV